MYLLDTNICIYIINKRPSQVFEKMRKLKPEQVKVSSISLGELEYGVYKSRHRDKNRSALLEFTSSFEILPFTSLDAEAFGAMRASLEGMDTPLGAYDVQIAAQALSRDLIVVTNNVREFERIPTLKLENWAF